MIKEIFTHNKTDDLEILFRMDSGHFDDDIIKPIESAGCRYLIMRSTQWRGQRVSNARLSSNRPNHFIHERWRKQRNNRACFKTEHLVKG